MNTSIKAIIDVVETNKEHLSKKYYKSIMQILENQIGIDDMKAYMDRNNFIRNGCRQYANKLWSGTDLTIKKPLDDNIKILLNFLTECSGDEFKRDFKKNIESRGEISFKQYKHLVSMVNGEIQSRKAGFDGYDFHNDCNIDTVNFHQYYE